MEASTLSRRIRFGRFEVDLESGELFRDGRRVRLQGQPIQILLVLLERPGHLVTREELQQRLWPKDTFVDFDYGLNAGIKRLRESLGDSADKPWYIETLPRRGYRFIFPVDHQSATDSRADLNCVQQDMNLGRMAVSEGKSKQTEQQWLAREWKWALAGVVLLLLTGIGVTWLARRTAQPGLAPEPKHTRLTTNPSEYMVGLGFISPDGKYLAFSDQKGLYLKLVDSAEKRPIPQPEGSTAESATWYPSKWFPEGTRFLATRNDASGSYSIWIVSVLGGPPRLIRDNACWGAPSPDGSQIVYLPGGPFAREIWVMGAHGEDARKFLTGAEGETLSWPVWSPDGQRIAYIRCYGNNQVSIESRDLKGGQLTPVLPDPSVWVLGGPWWFPNGRMLYATIESEPDNYLNSILWEIQIEPETGRPLSEPRRITRWIGNWTMVLSGTTDAKRMTVMRWTVQTDVFVGEWEAMGRRLRNPRRLTLDARYDFPGAWTRDSKAVLFYSDRNGQFDIFKEALDPETVVPLATGPGFYKHDPVLSPDGKLVLFLQDPSGRSVAGWNTRIIRVPLSGGPPETVLEGRGGINGLKCSWSPADLCVLGEESPDGKQFILTAFDPLKGRGRELTRATFEQSAKEYQWDLTRDGSRLAFAQNQRGREKRIQILPLSGGESHEVVIQREIQMTSLDWAADGRGFFVGSSMPGGLFFVDMDGRTEVLWRRQMLWELGSRGLLSPDGRHLAFYDWIIDSNVWMLEHF